MNGYELLRPWLFRLGGGDAEAAHEWTLRRLAQVGRHPAAVRALARAAAVPHSPVEVFGLTFPNPVGLAAGLDKDGAALPAWPALGFGFVEVGTVTRYAQPGNDRPRLFRLRASSAVINRMGFNNAGAFALSLRLAALGPSLPVPLGVSLGKSKVTPLSAAVEDYLASFTMLRPYGDYFALNVSSPNTPGLRTLQDRVHLAELLSALRERNHPDPRPLLVKIAPDLSDAAIADLLAVCAEHGVAGVIATNTTVSRRGLAPADVVRGGQAGGLSGGPLAARAREVVAFVHKQTSGSLPIIGVGGILTPDDALRLVDAGASLVQIYTGLVYRGPGLIRDTVTALAGRSAPRPVPAVAVQRAEQPVASMEERTNVESFGERLVRLVDERGPLCVGIDPHPGLLTAWGLPVTPVGLARFCEIVVEALGPHVPVLKPQSAFFELFGSAGIAVLESTIRQARERGALVLLDVKRGDIGSTATAYASAYLEHDSPLYCDAVTVSPYPGFGALTPFLDAAAAGGGGVFVLAATSNPDGRDLQQARCSGGTTVAQSVVDAAAARNDGARPLGSVGVVVGVTAGEVGVDLAALNGPVLAPGLGVQGGRPEDLAEVFARVRGLVLPSSSREILAQGPEVAELRAAARRTAQACRAALKPA